ncbi:MAG: ABC transporter transmembrane domain-containing protein, partial [Clostridium sp.]|nr:ABC transporter transmembrane domain-containing protein [Clostridium sp.]
MLVGRKSKNPMKTLKRLLGYVFKEYKFQFLFVVICILISSLATVASTLFLKTLIDDYITPFLGQSNPNFGPLLKTIGMMAIIYYIGTFSTYLYNRIMIVVAQGSLKKIRDDMFEHMEGLPIKYFDTHSHGEIMSLYTNDTDTLRQMISQSLPQLVSSVITVVSVFISMIVLSLPLTLVAVVMIFVMFRVIKVIGGKSSLYFGKQQKDLGKVNGFIEEMMEGQKVVKVFCHEDESKIDFDKLNDDLCDSAYKANTFANILMPIMGNLGYINYVLTAIVGGILAIGSVGGFTLGALASFLQLTRNLNQPISQMSQQFNAVIMALAGAERIFELLDEKHETDDGYVTLVNAKVKENGELEEVKERTGIWAWKHPHSDGTITYTRMLGDMVFDDVDFGYDDKKIILHNIKLFAKPGQKVAFVGA